jgi:transglutaminase-like putative cysteine protease
MTVAPALQRNIPWLLLVLAWIIVPHVEHLPPWITLLCVALGGWRWVAARRGLPLPNKWLLLALALTAGAGVLLTYRTITGRDAGVALLIVMLSLKLMEMRSVRDGIVMIFLGYFLIVTNFLYSQSILMGGYMLVAVLAITATLVGLNLPEPTLALKPKIRLAALLLAQGLPVMIVLFVLFPRAQSPLWGAPAPLQNAVTGLSDSMSPGDISRLGLSSAVAFRAEFAGAAPAPELRYWRGPVFWYFDGRTWSAGSPRRPAAVSLHVEGEPVTYTITLEPHDQQWLFALDFPITLPPTSSMTDDFQVLAAAPARQRLRYQITSQPKYRVETELRQLARRHALQLPPDVNPQARQLAQSWRANARSGKEIVDAALDLFSREAFFYTLSPPPLGFHSVDNFLFDSRRGFCEHYAGSFVFLMRAAGVPARVVTGYQGGEHNPIGNYLIVRQSDAHAWAEVWLEDQGWVRIDPTARIAPQRVLAEAGLLDALPSSEALPVFARMNPDWLRQLRFGMDLVNYNWHKWVLGYSHKRQNELLSRLGMGLESARGMIYGLLTGIGGLMLIFAAAMLWRLRAHPRDPVVAAYRRFCARLAQAGLARRQGEGPAVHAARVMQLRPDLAASVARISDLYIDLRYRPIPGTARAEQLRELKKQVWLFKP